MTSTAEAATMLYYDSVAAGSADALDRIDSQTDNTLISTSAASSSLGNRGTYAGTNTQTAVQGLGDGTDKMFRFGPNTDGEGTLNGALNVGHMSLGPYLEVSFTAAQTIALESLSFNLFVNSQDAANYAARDVGLFVKVGTDAFSQFGDLDLTLGRGDQGESLFSDNRTVNAGEEVILRLTFTDKTKTGTNLQSATRIGAINISGVAVPEPSSVMLGGLSLLALLRRRR